MSPGRNEEGRVACPSSFSISDSYDMKFLVIISSLESKWQDLKVGMPEFQLFYLKNEIEDL